MPQYQFPMAIFAFFDLAVLFALRPLRKFRSWLLCMLHGVEYKTIPTFVGPVFLRTRCHGQVKLGSNVRFYASRRFNPSGLTNESIIDVRRGGLISIGDETGFSSVVMSSKCGITVGSRVMVGANVRIFDHDFHPLEPERRSDPRTCGDARSREIWIGDDVFIGTNSIILKGTVIGDRSIIAAGSVVCGINVPPDSLVRGNPAVVEERKI